MEIVLPSGKFAEITPITWGDWCVIRDVMNKVAGVDFIAVVISLHIPIDGEKLELRQVMGLDVRDGRMLENEIKKLFHGPVLALHPELNNPTN